MSTNANSNNRVARLKARLQKEREARLKERNELKAAKARMKELEKRPTTEDVTKRTAELQGKLRTRAYKDAFIAAAKEAKVKAEHVDDLFDLAKLEMKEDEPDAKAIKAKLDGLLETRKTWAVESEEQEKETDDQGDVEEKPAYDKKAATKLQKDTNGSRGGHVGKAGMFTVRRSQLSDADWMQKNQSSYAEAVRNNTLHLIN